MLLALSRHVTKITTLSHPIINSYYSEQDPVQTEVSANVSQVPCPAALTEKSGCRRNDEVRLFPSTLPASIFKISTSQSTSVPLKTTSFIASQPSIPTLSSSPEPALTGLSTREIIGLGVSVSVFSLLLALLIYWWIRRRSKLVKKKPRVDETSPAAAPGYVKPELQGVGICELAAASLPELNPDNIHEASTGAMASELHPTHLLEMDASDLPELDAISPCNKPAEERLEAMQNPTNRF
ncbi:MAG: hypothetical protein L6R38_001244 [Xanthoria sp. 2 TBL-2021]|nr:MAG: hypothetical protein L6R38_001244 [Xanthoria sp. 2 TBL-2021]